MRTSIVKAGQKALAKTKIAGVGQPERLIADPHAFSRLEGVGMLGQVPQYKIPSYYYDYTTLELPLTSAEFAAEFGSERAIFDCSTDTEITCGRQTNALCGASVAAPFIATGLCIIAVGEGRTFCVQGASIPTPASAGTDQPPLPLVNIEASEIYSGSVDVAVANAGGARATPAQLWWGGPGHVLIEKYFQMFRLQVAIQRRFLFVDESLQDVGMCWTPPEFIGASSSELAPAAFVRAVNDVMREKAIGQTFLYANQGTDGTPDCLGPPMPHVTYGHPRVVGLSNRIYCFPQPLLLLPGMRFDLKFVPIEDESCFRMLENLLTAACIAPDENLDSGVSGVAATASCGLACTIPGGRVSLGVVLKGYELWPSACLEYIQNFVQPGGPMAAMISDSPYASNLMQKQIANQGKTRNLREKNVFVGGAGSSGPDHLRNVLGTKPDSLRP